MVSVEERVGDDVPGGIPRNFLLVKEDTHKLRDGEGRVGLLYGD